MAVINPLCSTNIDSHISEGVGSAAPAYVMYQERIYNDLDFITYKFSTFIMETTGGLSKAAFNFCIEIKKRYGS